MIVTILGCGTSSGVPRIGNDWGACDPAEPRNRRRRVSILVEHGGKTVLVDTGPDFREQMLSANVQRVDAVLLTHDHADHTHGIDDLRQFFHLMREPVQVHAMPSTWTVLKARFDYVFAGTNFYPATATPRDLPPVLEVGDLRISWLPHNHGNIDAAGFRFEADGKTVVYSTDVKHLHPDSDAFLSGVDVWIVDALRRAPHPTHSHLDQTLGWVERYRPRRAVLTHMDQTMDYARLRAALPEAVEPGFDGMHIDLT